MYVIGSFQYSQKLEIAIAKLEHMGIDKKRILVLPLDKRVEKGKTFDTMHQSDGVSFIELASILATIFMLLGAIYGFTLYLGPILWALFGFLFGGVLGFAIDFYFTKKKQKTQQKTSNPTDVFIMVNCFSSQVKKVKEILWEEYALGVTTYSNKNEIGEKYLL